MSKLFYVEVKKIGWVLAEDESEAAKFSNDIVNTENYTYPVVTEYNENSLKFSYKEGWNKNCLIYHKDQRTKDIALGDALNAN